jgi:hypothetical protein
MATSFSDPVACRYPRTPIADGDCRSLAIGVDGDAQIYAAVGSQAMPQRVLN